MKNILFVIIIIVISYQTMHGQPQQAKVVATIDGDEMYELLQPDDISAIRNSKFVSGTKAEQQISSDELAMGLRIENEKGLLTLATRSS